METNKRAQGGLAENTAAEFLRGSGYRILERNFNSPFGEIDIIASDGGYTVFVEVKSRNSAEFGRPQEAVNTKKQKHMIKTAISYLKIHKLAGTDMRFDVIAIGPGSGVIEHIKAAFTANPGYTC
jgi:putative endonuclease